MFGPTIEPALPTRRAAIERDPEALLEQIAQRLGASCRVVAAGVVDEGRLVPMAGPEAGLGADALFEIAERSAGPIRQLLEGRETVAVSGLPVRWGPMVFVGLRAGGDLVGVLVVGVDEPPDDETRSRLGEVGTAYGALFENAVAFAHEQRLTDESELLSEIVAGLGGSFQMPRLLGLVAQNCARVAGFDRGSILLSAEDGGFSAAASQFADGRTDLRLWGMLRAMREPIAAVTRAFVGGMPLAFERPEEAEALEPWRWVEPLELRSVLIVPLADRVDRLGVLILDGVNRRRITRDEVAAVRRLADRAAVTIGLARLIERERGAQRRSQLVLGTVVQAANQLNPTGVLTVIAEGINEVLHDHGTVAFLMENGRPGRLAVRGSAEHAIDLIDALADPVGSADGVSPLAAGHGGPTEIDPNHPDHPRLRALGLGRVIAIPIQRAGRDLGWVVSFDDGDAPYRGTDVRVAGALASQAALSLHTAQLLEAERATVSRLEEVDRLKTEFVAAVSHELRTPLTAIIGFSELLSELLGDAPPGEYVADVRREAAVIESLIGNLLDSSRLEAGMLSLNLSPTDLAALVGRAVDVVLHGYPHREFVVDAPAGLGRVVIDGVRVRQVLVNLLENAAKYSPDDAAIEVAASIDDDTVVFRVDDHGPGIPVDHRDLIFERFHRLSTDGAKPGTGIGLYLVKALVGAHGGTISVSDRDDGRGARFEVRLPLILEPAD
jgi:signal transduction histidine kinase